MNKSGVLLLSLTISVAYANDMKVRFENMNSEQELRIERFTSKLSSRPLLSVPIELVKEATSGESGACRFSEATQKIEILPEAFQMSDQALSQCLSRAYAHARYEEIESQWLEQIGEREAWVIRKGELSKVSLGQNEKMAPGLARSLWASFATREIVAEIGPGEGAVQVSRSIASSEQLPAVEERSAPARGLPDERVRRLLEL